MADESRATPAELTQKQKKFADYLIKLGRDRATEAAKLAGYSEKSARQSGYANMQKASVKAYIEERLKTAAEPRERAEAERKLVADGDEVLRFLSATMRGEVKDQFGLDAQLKDRLAAAKELQRILDVAKPAEQSGGSQTLIIEPIYGAPEADDGD
ncbi:terminase small subunit [Phascolarctobacterium succinatutens]|uniref:terminase small subunit n=1 Tax=Phascolarctobacterium succinatutens TaxID=626940 RepID=UPI003AAEC982